MYDTIIVGGGAAGMTAAIYAARKKMEVLVLEHEAGGQTALQPEIWNYPGYLDVEGFKLMQNFRKQATDYGAEIKNFKIAKISSKEVEDNHKIFVLENDKGEEIEGRSVIIASGAKPRRLGVPGEMELDNKGVTYCATCDAPLFKDKEVAVVGAGNTGLDAAMQLTKYASNIYVLVKGDVIKGDQVTYEKLKKEGKVEFIFNTETKEIKGDNFVNSLVYKDTTSGEEKEIAVLGVFVSIGSIPNSDFVKGFCELNQFGNIVIDPRTNATSKPGVFAAGDVTDVLERQTVVAAGEGAKASLQCYKWLQSR